VLLFLSNPATQQASQVKQAEETAVPMDSPTQKRKKPSDLSITTTTEFGPWFAWASA